MKTFLLSAALLLLCIAAHSQDYRPFLAGKLHYFTSTSNYSVRVDSIGEVTGDSVFWMNEIATPPPMGCQNYYHYLPGQEGLYGDRFVEMPGGVLTFISRAGDSATFQTQAAVGAAWAFATTGNLTATLVGRSQITFLGATDSVLTYDISDGQQFQLSQHHGFLSHVNLGYYLNGGSPLVSTLYELPSVPDFKKFYDWQPGDTYGTTFEMFGTGFDKYTLHRILSRTMSLDSTTLFLGEQQQTVQAWTGGPNVYSNGTPVLTFDSTLVGFLQVATFEVWSDTNHYFWQQPWQVNQRGRMELPFIHSLSQGVLDSCGYYPLMPFADQAMLSIKYTQGLGMVHKDTIIGMTTSGYHLAVHRMDCYEQALHDTLAPCPMGFDLLPTDPQKPKGAAISLWQDPTNLQQGIHWEGLDPALYHWQLFDMSGRLVWKKQVPMEGNGRSPLTITGSSGMYLLHITHQDGSWGKTLKVPHLER